MNGVLVSV